MTQKYPQGVFRYGIFFCHSEINVYPLEVGMQMATLHIFFRAKHAELSARIGPKGQDGGLL